MNTGQQYSLIGVGLLLILATGLWLRFAGKPMNMGLSTIHKLAGLGVGVLLILRLRQAQVVSALGVSELTLAIATGLFFVALPATGAILSGDKPPTLAVRCVHRILPYLTALGSGGLLCLLSGR